MTGTKDLQSETIELSFEIDGIQYDVKARVCIFPTDTPLFHWGTYEDIDPKVQNNSLQDVDFSFKENSMGLLNDGFYVSTQCDSMNFGQLGVALTAKKPLYFLDIVDLIRQFPLLSNIGYGKIIYAIGRDLLKSKKIDGILMPAPIFSNSAWVNIITDNVDYHIRPILASDFNSTDANAIDRIDEINMIYKSLIKNYMVALFNFDSRAPIPQNMLASLGIFQDTFPR